jgi:hypothetical protein
MKINNFLWSVWALPVIAISMIGEEEWMSPWGYYE